MPDLMTSHEVASVLGLSVRGLNNMRREGRGPSHYLIGRLVRYAPQDVAAWLATHKQGG